MHLRPFFVCLGVGAIVMFVAQTKIEGELKSRNEMPQTSWWAQSTNAHQARILREHREYFPNSKWRYVWAAGLDLLYLSLIVLAIQNL
jgi:hypothetical protein